MAKPIIKSGSFVCSGQNQHIYDIGFSPDIVFAKLGTGNTTPWMWWTKTSWVQRTQRVGATDSFYTGIMGVDQSGTALLLGNNAQANVAGETLYWFALADNKAGVLTETGWLGNSTGQNLIVGSVFTSGAPASVMIKRDSNFEPAFRAQGMTRTAYMAGGAPTSTGILSINSDGSIDVGTDPNVNQAFGAAIGEGHDCISFWETPNTIEHLSYVGNSTSGRTITLKSGWTAITVVADASGIKAGLKTKEMPADFICAADANVYTDALSISGNTLTFGTNNVYNTSGVTYYLTVFYESVAGQIVETLPRSETKKAVVVRGASTANVSCGNSDTLSIGTAHSLEWWGMCRGNTALSSNNYQSIMMRSNGADGGASVAKGLWSHGIFASRPNDLGDWAGNQFFILTTDYNDWLGTESNIRTRTWRTGILVPREPFHLLVTTNGSGRWRLYLNGKLVKQRNLDMTTLTIGDGFDARVNAGAGSGHRMSFGARWNGSAFAQLGRLVMLGASVYNSELTPAQAYQLYRRHFLEESSQPDITPVERWLADNASGTSMPANVNSANNGTISSSAGVVLRDTWLFE